jgi:hypothetical protein
MVDSSREVDLRGFERIIGWEVYGKEEDAALEWTVALEFGILISHLFFAARISAVINIGRTASHTGPIIVACQWN